MGRTASGEDDERDAQQKENSESETGKEIETIGDALVSLENEPRGDNSVETPPELENKTDLETSPLENSASNRIDTVEEETATSHQNDHSETDGILTKNLLEDDTALF